jgi:type IV pilus assembly protein PilA
MSNKFPRERKGFTLIEILVVIGILGILAAIAIPQYNKVRTKGMNAAATSALSSLKVAQESYFLVHDEYADHIDDLASWYTPEEGVTVTIINGGFNSWSAWAKHQSSDDRFTYNSKEGGLL